mgnify:CR=1 FL=1
MAEYYNTPGTASGIPKYYANWDANYWVVAPTPNSTNLITLAYTKQPDSITASPGSTQGTYTSNKYQDLLLYKKQNNYRIEDNKFIYDIINTFFWGEKYLNFTKKLY